MLQTAQHLAKRALANGSRTQQYVKCSITHKHKQRARRIAAPLASRSGRSAAARVLNLERSALQAPPHALGYYYK